MAKEYVNLNCIADKNLMQVYAMTSAWNNSDVKRLLVESWP